MAAIVIGRSCDHGAPGVAAVGDVIGRMAVIVADMLVSGGSMRRAVDVCRARGAVGVIAALAAEITAGSPSS